MGVSFNQRIVLLAQCFAEMLALHLDDPLNTRPEVAMWCPAWPDLIAASRHLVAVGFAIECPPPDRPGMRGDGPYYRLTEAGVQFLRASLAER